MASYRKRGRSWYVRYRDEHGQQIEVKAGPDQGMARRIAAELESRVQAIRAGVVDANERQWVEAEQRPIVEHVHDWHANLLARGRGILYANQARDIALKVLGLARIGRISQLNVPSVERALHDLRSMPGRGGNPRLSDATMRQRATSPKTF